MLTPYLSPVWSFLKHHRWKSILAFVGIVIVGGGAYAAFKPTKPEYITEVSKQGDLRQTVEAVGTVISDRDLELQFRNIGIVAQVLVKEGDTVKAGQKLASLRSGDLAASISSAAARVREAEASLRTLKEGTRPEEIAIAEAQLLNRIAALDSAKTTLRSAEENMDAAQSKLDALRQEASISLAGQMSQAPLIAQQNLTTAEHALDSIEEIFSEDNVTNAINRESKGIQYSSLLADQERMHREVRVLSAKSFSTTDYQMISSLLEEYKKTIELSYRTITTAYDLIVSLPEIPDVGFTNTEKESYRLNLAEKRSSAQSALSSIDNWTNSFRDASATYETRIRAEESAYTSAKGTKEKAEADIKNYESSIRIDEAQLALKRAGTRQSDIDAAQARLRAASAELARANANFIDTIISAPSNGRVTKVNIKVGEITPSGPAITMLGESPYRIEIFASEIDIPKVKYEQPATVELDAFPDVHYKLRVGEVDEAQSLVDGVAKYRIKLDFVHPHDEFKLGMSGDTIIVTDERKNVVYVPSRAVLQDGERKYVRVLMGEEAVLEKDVETGMEAEEGDLEITKGLEAGESVIILVK